MSPCRSTYYAGKEWTVHESSHEDPNSGRRNMALAKSYTVHSFEDFLIIDLIKQQYTADVLIFLNRSGAMNGIHMKVSTFFNVET